jgi:hypothetical protein
MALSHDYQYTHYFNFPSQMLYKYLKVFLQQKDDTILNAVNW